MIVAASRLVAILMEGESLAAVEMWRARDLFQTAMVQQHAYSYSRYRIHSTPRPSRSYNRHIDEPAVSSSARNHDAPRGPNPAHGGANAQDVVDHGRARRDAALGRYQPAPVQPAASVDRGTVGDDGFFTSLTEEEAYINIDNPYDGYGEVSIGYGKNIGTSGNSGGVNKYTPGGIMIIEED